MYTIFFTVYFYPYNNTSYRSCQIFFVLFPNAFFNDTHRPACGVSAAAGAVIKAGEGGCRKTLIKRYAFAHEMKRSFKQPLPRALLRCRYPDCFAHGATCTSGRTLCTRGNPVLLYPCRRRSSTPDGRFCFRRRCAYTRGCAVWSRA